MSDAVSEAFAKLRRAAEGLPHVVEGTSYGTPALKVGKTLLARLKDADTVVLPCARGQGAAARGGAGDLFLDSSRLALVLARIEAISEEELRRRVEIAWRMQGRG